MSADPNAWPDLTEQELRRATFWKWTYGLKANRFTAEEAHRLIFARLLVWAGCWADDRAPAREEQP